jgi:hypothetical protein
MMLKSNGANKIMLESKALHTELVSGGKCEIRRWLTTRDWVFSAEPANIVTLLRS